MTIPKYYADTICGEEVSSASRKEVYLPSNDTVSPVPIKEVYFAGEGAKMTMDEREVHTEVGEHAALYVTMRLVRGL